MAEKYDPSFSANRFGLLASCRPHEKRGLLDFLKTEGAEIKSDDSTGNVGPGPSS